jgi:hypothetical protein
MISTAFTSSFDAPPTGELVAVELDPRRQLAQPALASAQLHHRRPRRRRPTRNVHEAASHADPRTTMRYGRGRGSLDRDATCIVTTVVAGASR